MPVMTAERDLGRLLATMSPELRQGGYVFVSLPPGRPRPPLDEARPVVVVEEDEGTTWVLERSTADRLGLHYGYVAAAITLRVRSALEAVGLTAAVAACLTEAGISCNVVAGFHHDHLFVPLDRGQDAVDALSRLSEATSR